VEAAAAAEGVLVDAGWAVEAALMSNLESEAVLRMAAMPVGCFPTDESVYRYMLLAR
jgi:hypothetical protein